MEEAATRNSDSEERWVEGTYNDELEERQLKMQKLHTAEAAAAAGEQHPINMPIVERERAFVAHLY